MSDAVRLENVSKVFASGTQALDSVSLRFGEGSFTCIVGPSGCGKSTLLRLIAGLEAPSQGSIIWPGGKKRIGFVFQEPTLMPWARALANVALPLTLKGVPRAEREARAAALLQRVGLSGFERAFPAELSGGMKMRVSIARALAADPELLLMDEPFAALDEFTRQELNDDLIALAVQQKLTTIFVTHSIYESAYLAPDIVVMRPRPGRIAATLHDDLPANRNTQWRTTEAFGARVRRILSALEQAKAA